MFDSLLSALETASSKPTELYINAKSYMWLLADLGIQNITAYFPTVVHSVYGLAVHVDTGLIDGMFILM